MGCSPKAQNLALNKPYTLSTPPNYVNSAPLSDKTSLTDGVYTNSLKSFWTRKTTVGWQNRQVEITIDLSAVKPIGSATFNTVRNEKVGINYPKNIFVFLSEDGENYTFEGDAAFSPENKPGSYKVHTFSLEKINKSARYVKIAVIPNGKRIFFDEIEVLETNNAQKLKEFVSVKKLRPYIDSIIAVEDGKQRIENIVNNLQSENSNNTLQQKPLDQLLSKSPEEAKSILLIETAKNLQEKFKTPFVVTKVSPWDSISEFYNPKIDFKELDYEFIQVVGTKKYGAFTITNTSLTAQYFSFSNINSSHPIVHFFHVPFVSSGSYPYVADPLLNVDKLEIASGSTQLFLFKISAEKSGTTTSKIEIGTIDKKVTLNLTIQTVDFQHKIAKNLPNANIWAYLNTPMLKGLEKAAGRDLAEHHINTIVLNPRILPDIKGKDYSKTIDYLSNFKKESVTNILLFTSFSSRGRGESGPDFMTKDWKNNFLNWYKNTLKVIRENGFSNSKVFIYPYDEVRGQDIDDFKKFATWAKKDISGLKIFATISNEDAANEIIPLIDIAQVQNKGRLLKDLPNHSTEIWTYMSGSPARALPSYQFYRLKAWRAFMEDCTGVGFWSYSGEGKVLEKNLISRNLTTPKSSYSVIYNGEDQNIISSRRWEAFSMGLEDYAVLKIYAEKYGTAKTKILVKSVLDDATNTEKADEVISKILNSLK